MGSSLDADQLDENCSKTIKQQIELPFYGVHPYTPDIYNLNVINKRKEKLQRDEPIFIKFDPLEKRIVFKSNAFLLKSD
jgi:hypothetical protein